jgi:ubiquinol-cytochrome c reductase cytochrome c1 subunit
MIQRILIAALILTCGQPLWAAGGGTPPLLESHVRLDSKMALQRGARTFVNYCMGCHSANFMRYSRLVEDLGLSEATVKTNLMFGTDKIGDTMSVAMRPQDAEAWFGVVPPDLSVIARARGADWLYSFLLGFYRDDNRANGVNNLYFPDTAMPAVLSGLQGVQRKNVAPAADKHGAHGPLLELEAPGTQTPEEYAVTVRDLVSFLVYLSEPAKLVRYKVGFWVIAFLLVLLLATYLMKREYWKDVH